MICRCVIAVITYGPIQIRLLIDLKQKDADAGITNGDYIITSDRRDNICSVAHQSSFIAVQSMELGKHPFFF